MKTIFTEDIYNIVASIIIPVMVPLLSAIFNYFKSHKYGEDRFWKCRKKKSSLDSYINYCIKWYLSGIVVLFLYIMIILVLDSYKVEMDEKYLEAFYVVLLIYFYFYFTMIVNGRNEIIQLKRFKRFEKQITYILCIIPIIVSGVIWIYIPFNNSNNVSLAITFVIVLLEIAAFVLLDDKNEFEYVFARFYLSDGLKINKIKTNLIVSKGNWIIVKDDKLKKEIRFRRKDVDRIEYFS